MDSILAKIVEHRRHQIVRQKAEMPLESFAADLTPSDRNFAEALRQPAPAFILECKQASPSKGLIRADFDVESIARVYGHYASAISVLTEPEFFRGSFEDLRRVRDCAPQPVLCKDFIVDPYQVLLARHYGADAILLILAVLSDSEYQGLADVARRWRMAVLTEVSNRAEQQRALRLGASIVGINNRNLRDLSIDSATTIELAPELRRTALVVSESGYSTHREVRQMSRHANAFLIGSSLMAQEDLIVAVKRIVFGDHKVCGLTRNEDARIADRAGAVYGGAIFAQQSSRRVSRAVAAEVFAGTDLLRVGVFQNQPVEDITEIARHLGLSAVQLHGDESLDDVCRLRESLPESCRLWRALRVTEVQRDMPALIEAGVERVVVDNAPGDQRGGTGQAFDWSELPPTNRQQILLAGGIGPENIQAAMTLDVAGLDMNSGLEDAPGKKSAAKIEHAFRQLRRYSLA